MDAAEPELTFVGDPGWVDPPLDAHPRSVAVAQIRFGRQIWTIFAPAEAAITIGDLGRLALAELGCGKEQVH